MAPALRPGRNWPRISRAGPASSYFCHLLPRAVALAAWLGWATERLATRIGEGVGGLLNATFGNAAELIIALVALRAGLHDVVE